MIAQSRFVVHEPSRQQGKWNEVFGNDHPIQIEIGMGKGQFMMQLAAQNPQINYIGIEKYSTVLLRAVQKMEVLELSNLKFIRMDAEDICEVFGTGEVAKLYLNFSDPWPKDRHAKRRLPSRQFWRVIIKSFRRMHTWSLRQIIKHYLTLHWRKSRLRGGKWRQLRVICTMMQC